MSSPLSLKDLRSRTDAGESFSYLYFWGHTPRKDGVLTSTCFSQWFVSPFELDGITYQTAEHYMMAEKARLFKDAGALQRILGATTPGAAKAFGREVLGFELETWSAHCFDIVVSGNLAKFSSTSLLKNFLAGTGNKVLVEASPVDPIWGIGLAADNVRSQNPDTWEGLNLLGFALMAVRERIVL